MTYRIFDSLDRPASRIVENPRDLHGDLEVLNEEAEQEVSTQCSGLSYAIGKVLPCGTVTFDWG